MLVVGDSLRMGGTRIHDGLHRPSTAQSIKKGAAPVGREVRATPEVALIV